MTTTLLRTAALATLGLLCLAGCDCGTCETQPTSAQSSAAAAPEPAAPTTAAVAAGVPVRFEIKGMHCGGCADAIAAETKGMPGVQQVAVSFDDSRADIVLADPAQAQAVEDAIRKLGYTVTRQK